MTKGDQAAARAIPSRRWRTGSNKRDSTTPTGLFVDGGVTPYNNPTMALLMMTQLEGFRHQVAARTGPALSITSIGTGTRRTTMSSRDPGWFGPLRVRLSALFCS